MDKLIQLKKESMNLEIMLNNKKNSVAALEAYDSLKQIFEKIEKMDKYQPIGRVRSVHNSVSFLYPMQNGADT
jgi:hypothetical protein